MVNEKKEIRKDQKQFEFTLYLNDNIIVQRFFGIIGYNYKAVNSMNFKEAVDDNMYIIKKHLETKSMDFVNDNTRIYSENPSYEQNNAQDVMRIVIKNGDKIIASRQWDARIYPVKVRYTVDIREHIYNIITRIQKCLSEKTDRLETEYLEYELA